MRGLRAFKHFRIAESFTTNSVKGSTRFDLLLMKSAQLPSRTPSLFLSQCFSKLNRKFFRSNSSPRFDINDIRREGSKLIPGNQIARQILEGLLQLKPVQRFFLDPGKTDRLRPTEKAFSISH